MDFAQTALVLAVVTFWLYRLELFAGHFLPKPVVAPEPVKDEPIPADLVALAKQEGESWAQQGVVDAIQEHYRKLHDWNKVREAVGLTAGTM